MVLAGLGLACSTMLGPGQLYQLALDAGFPPGVDPGQGNAGTMAAIAMRESGGCADAHNNQPGEDSYGLWQINTKANPIAGFGLTDPAQLYDPAINAQAAYQLWGGNDANLDTAWYVNRPGYKEAYLKYIPVVQAAVGQQSIPIPDMQYDTGQNDLPGISAGVVLVAVGAVGLALLLDRG